MRRHGVREAHLESHRGLVRVLEFQELGHLDGEGPWMGGLVSRSSSQWQRTGSFERKLGDIRRKPSSWGSISTDMVVALGTQADGESADAVAWPFDNRCGSGVDGEIDQRAEVRGRG